MRIDKNLLKNVVNSRPELDEADWSGAVVFLCTDQGVFFIMRSLDMPTHKGQVGFFGGHKKVGETPLEVAGREFTEETGLPISEIEYLGCLPLVRTSFGKAILPIVCYYAGDPKKVLNNAVSNGEWSDLFTYPWKQLLEEDSWSMGLTRGLTPHPVLFHTLRTPWLASKFSQQESYMLWGATAWMVWEMVQRINNKDQ